MIVEMGCGVVIVAANCLGTINHTLLTARYLQGIGVKEITVVMMGQKKPDLSSRSNGEAIRELMPGVGVFAVPYLGDGASKVKFVKQNAKFLQKTLARVMGGDRVGAVPSNWKGVKQQESCYPSKQVP